MGPIGPMMTRTWVTISRAVLAETPPRRTRRNFGFDDEPRPMDSTRIDRAMGNAAASRGNSYVGRRDDTAPRTVGSSVNPMDLQPSLSEFDFEDEDQPGLKDILGV